VWNKTSGFDIPEADSSASAENCFFWGNGWAGAQVCPETAVCPCPPARGKTTATTPPIS